MTRQSYDLSHPEYMWVSQDNKALYGCNQDWYLIEFRRRAGCGPVAATNILLYLRKKYGLEMIPYRSGGIGEVLAAMNDVFLYVRPKRRGLHTVKKFVKGMCKLGHNYGLSFWYQYLVIPPQDELRPGLEKIVRFIEDGLKNDVPVAFLNLDAGEVEDQLSSWHWVTVVGMSYGASAESAKPDSAAPTGIGTADGESAGGTADGASSDYTGRDDTAPEREIGRRFGRGCECERERVYTLYYYDQSKSLKVDLNKWLGTTARGGGFAYFRDPKEK